MQTKLIYKGLLAVGLSVSLSSTALAEEPRVGRQAAAKYFQKGDDDSSTSGTNYGLLMLHVGGFPSSACYQWKDNTKRTGIGKATYGVTYLYDHWGSLDINLRFDFAEYKVDEDRATKLSVMPLWTFPMAERTFPLYFGFGAGAGVFFQQLEDESNVSLDYQLVLGVRFVDLIQNFGGFVEYGLKNHLHILSDGQFNGTALAGGAVFTF